MAQRRDSLFAFKSAKFGPSHGGNKDFIRGHAPSLPKAPSLHPSRGQRPKAIVFETWPIYAFVASRYVSTWTLLQKITIGWLVGRFAGVGWFLWISAYVLRFRLWPIAG